MDKYISIKEASELFGVTTTTLRRWEAAGSFTANHRTFGNHRRYKLEDVLSIVDLSEKCNDERITVCYARVSTPSQKDDLVRQAETLETFCETNSYDNIQTIRDIGI